MVETVLFLGVSLVVTVIKKKEIMTLRELKEKYATKWICYEYIDDDMEGAESALCYAVYVADTEDEIYQHSDPSFTMRRGGIVAGYSVVFPMEIGGIYVHA